MSNQSKKKQGRRKGRQGQVPVSKKGTSVSDVDTDALEAGPRRFRWSRWQQWAAVIAFVWLHVAFVRSIGAATSSATVTVVSLLLVGIITVSRVPQTRKKWWRWLVLLWLTLVATPPNGLVVFFVGEVWLMHRCWLIEYLEPFPEGGWWTRKLVRVKRLVGRGGSDASPAA